MRPQFEWEVGRQDGEWETIARTEKHLPWYRRMLGRVPPWAFRWVCYGVIAAVVACAAGGYALAQFRSRRVHDQLIFQIQSVIDLEARTFEQRDRDLFLAQQDEQSPGWYVQQTARYRKCPRLRLDTNVYSDRCHPIRPAQVQDVDVRGEIAQVEVLEEQSTVRRVRFYRRTDLGWKHTAPQAAFWAEPVHIQYQDLNVRCHKRDLPYIAPALERIATVKNSVCADLACPPGGALAVAFVVEANLGQLPRMERGGLVLASPWLSGIPVEQEQDGETLDMVSYWTAYTTAYRATAPQAVQKPNSLQEALLSEYATWHAAQDPAQAPLLKQLIERRGPRAPQEALVAAGKAKVESAMVANYATDLLWTWRPTRRTEVWLTVAHDALSAEQEDVLLLLQEEANRLAVADPRSSTLRIRAVRVLD